MPCGSSSFVATHIGQGQLSTAETEREGTVRAEAAIEEAGFPAEATGPIKVLVGQFLRNAFVNSGGARHILRLAPRRRSSRTSPRKGTSPRPASS